MTHTKYKKIKITIIIKLLKLTNNIKKAPKSQEERELSDNEGHFGVPGTLTTGIEAWQRTGSSTAELSV